MKVVLLQDVKKMGKKGDVVEVSDGYGRNVLIRKGLGVEGTKANLNTAAQRQESKVFKDKVATPEWQAKIRQIVPSYGTQLNGSPEKVAQEWAYTAKVLQLTPPPAMGQVAAPAAAPAEAPKAPKANAASDMAL